MDAIELLHQRSSCARLAEPAPNNEQLANLFKAALRAPDHANLKPYRFLTVMAEQRQALGALFLEAGLIDTPNLAETQRNRLLNMPLRAPLVIVAIAKKNEHPKVPVSEQLISAGCAVHAMLYASYAQGLGAIWRTGPMASQQLVKTGLGLAANEEIIGFLYVGQAQDKASHAGIDFASYVQPWQL